MVFEVQEQKGANGGKIGKVSQEKLRIEERERKNKLKKWQQERLSGNKSDEGQRKESSCKEPVSTSQKNESLIEKTQESSQNAAKGKKIAYVSIEHKRQKRSTQEDKKELRTREIQSLKRNSSNAKRIPETIVEQPKLSIVQRASIYRLHLKNAILSSQIKETDEEKDALFTSYSTQILALIERIKSLKEQKALLEFLNFPLPSLSAFESQLESAKLHLTTLREASKHWKIDGQIAFNPQQLAQTPSILTTEHIEKIQKRVQLKSMHLKESLLNNKQALLQAEIKSLSESISTTKLKLSVLRDK